MSKRKGPTFSESRSENVEQRQYKVHRTGLERPSSRIVYFNCPFCEEEIKAYVWSICGGGKRCTCGALFGSHGLGYHFKNR